MHSSSQALPASNDLLAAIVSTSLDCIIVIDETGAVVAFNPAAETVFGVCAADVMGRQIGDIIVPPAHRTAHKQGFDRYLAGGAPKMLNRRIETEAQRADGGLFPVELAITEVPGGERRHFAASLRDLSDRRRIERERDEVNSHFGAFMANAPVGMYLKDSRGRYIMANPEFERVFGQPLVNILGRSASDLLSPEEAAVVAQADAQVVETGKPMAIEERLSKDDAYEWSLVLRFPIWSESEQAWRIGGFDIDISPQKRAADEVQRTQQALSHSEKLNTLGALLAGVAHELNNPLAVLLAQASMLEMEAEGGKSAERAQRIKRAAERCARIVETFLALARQSAPRRELLCLNELAEAVLDLVGYNIRIAQVEVERKLAPALPQTLGDPDRLHQLILNLVLNALQAMEILPDESTRTLRLESGLNGDTLWLTVSDSGPGIDPAIAGQIFDPFFTTKGDRAGTGLGLSFSRATAEAHGGTLELVEGGKGTCLCLRLPLTSVEDATHRSLIAPDVAIRPRRKRRALIVDDDPDVAQSLGEMLSLMDFAASAAYSAEEALDLLERQAFELVLSDLHLPGRDGIALLGTLAEGRNPHATRLAFVTGDRLGVRADERLEKSGRPVLSKPFDLAALQAIVQRIDSGGGSESC